MVKDLTGRYKLTDEERDLVVKEAEEKKRQAIDHEERIERMRQWEIVLSKAFTSKELAMYVEWRANRNGVPFTIDSSNQEVFKLLCQYFTSNPSFEKAGDYSLRKGIMLCGAVGRGKTHLMSLFKGNQKRSYQMVSCRLIADKFKTMGEEVLHTWSHPINVPTHLDTFNQNQIGVCFDDLGTEREKRNYGDSVNVMADILLNRYDYAATPHHWTHITTNLTADEIEACYGTRVRSRMREMFNMITLGGEDRRR